VSSLKRIYTDDPLLKYKETEVPAPRSKQQIDGVLAEYGVKEVYWKWDKDAIESGQPADIRVMFKVEEELNGVPVNVPVRINCPTIWDHARPRGRPPRPEQINWDVSMRAMYHFIYTHLNSDYAMQSGVVVAFLGYVQNVKGENLKDALMPKLGEHAALEYLATSAAKADDRPQT
jgi:hypothetical protein